MKTGFLKHLGWIGLGFLLNSGAFAQDHFFPPSAIFQRHDIELSGRLRHLTLENVSSEVRKDVIVLERQGTYPDWTYFLSMYSLKPKERVPKSIARIQLPQDVVFYGFLSPQESFGASLLLLRAHRLEIWAPKKDTWGPQHATEIHGVFERPAEGGPAPFTPLMPYPSHSKEFWIPTREGLSVFALESSGLKHQRFLSIRPRAYYRSSKDKLAFDFPFWLRGSLWFPSFAAGQLEPEGERLLFFPWMDQVDVLSLSSGRQALPPIHFRQLTEAERDDDQSYVVTVPEDLNGDGRTDFLVSKFQGTPTTMRADTNIFLTTKNGSVPTKGLTLKPEGNRAAGGIAVDLNQDGKKDLAVASAQFSAWAVVRALLRKEVQVIFSLYFFQKNGYQLDSPDFKREISFRFDLMNAQIDGILPSLEGDFNGDGFPDTLYARDRTALTVLVQQPGKEEIFPRTPSATYDVTVPRFLRIGDVDGDHLSDVVLFEKRSQGNRRISLLLNTGQVK